MIAKLVRPPRTNRAGTRRQPVAGGNPPETRQTVHRLAALGYHWHNLMHLITAVVSDGIHHAMKEHCQTGPGDYARRPNELPGDWPPSQAPGPN